MYELGEDAGPIRAAICGVALFRPVLQLPAQNPFPKATQTLRGFSRLMPSKARDPLSWLVLVLFCDYWLSQDVPLLAVAALWQFDTYLRPGETLALKKGHVLSPVRNAGVAYRRWGLAVCPDDILFVGDAGRFWAVGLLQTPHALFGSLQLQRYEQPSEESFHKRMDLAATQKRGRWGSPKSMVRHGKGAKLLRQLSFVLSDF